MDNRTEVDLHSSLEADAKHGDLRIAGLPRVTSVSIPFANILNTTRRMEENGGFLWAD